MKRVFLFLLVFLFMLLLVGVGFYVVRNNPQWVQAARAEGEALLADGFPGRSPGSAPPAPTTPSKR